MPAGFQVKGDHLTLQIDETYRNLMLKTKSTFTCSTTSANVRANHYFGNFTVTANAFPVIAIRGGSGKVGFAGFTKSGSDYTFYYASTVSGDTITYYHFDVPNPGDTANYIEIFDASANRIFNGLGKPMRVEDQVGVTSSPSYTSGRTYASIQSASGFSDQDVPPAGKGAGTYRAWQCCAQWTSAHAVTIGGTSHVNGLKIEDTTSGGTAFLREQYATCKFTIVDVTGY